MAKLVVLVIIAGTLLFSLLSWVRAPEMTDIARFVLTCALCYFLYCGKNWARWTLGVLLILGAAFGIYAVSTIAMPMGTTVLLGVMAAFYAASALLLLSDKVVGTYFNKEGQPSPIQASD